MTDLSYDAPGYIAFATLLGLALSLAILYL